MANVYLCGHGQWKTKGEAKIFTVLPKGTTLKVYVPVGRFLGVPDAMAIIRGDEGAMGPDQVFGPYQSCPDTSLFPAVEFQGQFQAVVNTAGGQLYMVMAETKLSALLNQFAGNDIFWIACRGHNLDRQLKVVDNFPRVAWKG
ncbi:MAG TPA: hypothetical protein PLF54_02110 [Deltaproteobacteria bacterium]|jgi:hypothetical protein|nr:hypothetical protein [Deltaproteobacteria bacterium]HQJ07767.1 hypothetical protein [Deltaproteobacteria bacterium]